MKARWPGADGSETHPRIIGKPISLRKTALVVYPASIRIAVAPLILSVPGAVLATIDIAQRLKLAAARSLSRHPEGGADRVQLCSGDEPALDLTRAGRDRVMDALSKGIDKKP